MDCPTPAYEFRRAVAVAIADAAIRLAQDEAECNAWAGYAQFTNGLHAVTSLPRQPRTPSRRSPDDLSGGFPPASPAAEIDSDNQSEIAVSGSAAVFQSRRVALKRSQHAAVTRYRYFGCLGPLFLHQLFFGQDIVPVALIKSCIRREAWKT